MTESLIPPRFLFRYSAICLQQKPLWSANGAKLGDKNLLPEFGQLDDDAAFAQVRVGWSLEGLAVAVEVRGKRQPPWCRESRPDDSDGLRLWIDTRDTHNIHRATRFCHQFIFMPTGCGRGLDEPVAEQLLINRARENARPVRPGVLQVRREKKSDGYRLEALVPAAALTGFEPQDHPRLGFTYAVIDRELGEQAWSCPSELPYREDPSLWGTLELEGAGGTADRPQPARSLFDSDE